MNEKPVGATAMKFSAARWSLQELQKQLKALPAGSVVEIECGQNKLNGFGAGIETSCSLSIKGEIGDFAFLAANAIDCDVSGSAGDALGHSLESGNILIHGQVGHSLGCYATGGFIAVHRTAGDRCAEGLAGADVLVRGKVGHDAGAGMRDGILVLGNGAGEDLGSGIQGGVIYVRGNVVSVSEDLKPARVKEADSLRLSLLLARAGVKAAIADFKLYVPRESTPRERK